MQDSIILLTFSEPSKAYQALGELKEAHAQDKLQLKTAAVVDRDATGALKVRDGFSDGAPVDATLVGGLLGGLLGVMAGPLGVLLVGAPGAALGSLASLDTVDERLSLLEQMGHSVPVGSTALFASVEEDGTAVVDGIARTLGALVLRRPAEAVMREVEVAQEAEEVAAQEARTVLRKRHEEEWLAKFDTWKEEVGEQLTELRARIESHLPKK